jgi:16S rRNA A1518/A1519 N6-dimethyltransferase RsmA/KsgA/DIM1 with predicted DNA glycosylase/AP lyase activity
MIKNLIKVGFQKDIVQNLFEKMNISENTRAEDLNIEQWIEVTEFLSRT